MIHTCSEKHSSDLLSGSHSLSSLVWLVFLHLIILTPKKRQAVPYLLLASFIGFVCVFFVANPYLVYADTVVPESIFGEEIWDISGSPYIISVPTTIEVGSTVSVDPGVHIIFASSSLRVLGNFFVRGSEASTTLLYSNILDDGLQLAPPILSFGGKIELSYASLDGLGSVMGFDDAQIIVDHTIFNRMGIAGIGVYGAFVSIRNSVFKNIYGHSIMMYRHDEKDSYVSISKSAIGKSIPPGDYYGLYVDDGQHAEALNNFWGAISGPYHETLNSLGEGSSIYGDADIFSFLTHDPNACCSGVLFLPGIEASRLYLDQDGKENRLWEPNQGNDIELLSMNSDGKSINKVYTKEGDVIGEGFLEHIGPNIYKSFIQDMDKLVIDSSISSWKTITYDWRLSLDDILSIGDTGNVFDVFSTTSTSSIIYTLKNLASSSITGRVTIVAHSYGGLVTKRLMQILELNNRADLVDKIIFVAVPQTGTPQAIGSLLHGFDEGIPFLASAQAMRKLGINMPSAYSLLPSASYLSRDSRPLILINATSSFSFIKRLRNTFGTSINTLPDLVDFLKGIDGRSKPKDSDLTNPNILNTKLINKTLSLHQDIDSWTPPVGVNLIEIGGWGRDTLVGISYEEGRKKGKPILKYKPILAFDGDGTVTLGSAWALSTASNIDRYEVNLVNAGKGLIKNRYHADILEVSELRSLIKSLILKLPTLIPTLGIVRKSSGTDSDENEVTYKPQKKKQVFLYSDNHVIKVKNSSGEDVPDVDYREFGDVSYAGIPEDDSDISSGESNPHGNNNGNISIIIENKPVASTTIDIDIPIDNATANDNENVDIDEITSLSISVDIDDDSFVDISVSTTSVITIDFNATTTTDTSASTTKPHMNIDDDGDGVIDRIIEVTSETPVETETLQPISIIKEVEGGRSGGRRHVIETQTQTQTKNISTSTSAIAVIPKLIVSTETLPIIKTSTSYAYIASVFSVNSENSDNSLKLDSRQNIDQLIMWIVWAFFTTLVLVVLYS